MYVYIHTIYALVTTFVTTFDNMISGFIHINYMQNKQILAQSAVNVTAYITPYLIIIASELL